MRRLSVILLGSILFLWLALPAAAQTPTPGVITEFQLLILPPTGNPLTVTPISTITTTIGPTANCGKNPTTTPPPVTAINPGLFELNDPFSPGKVCQLAFPANLAEGTYQWAGVLRAASCNPTGGQVITPCPGPRTVGIPTSFQIVNPVLAPPASMGLRVSQ